MREKIREILKNSVGRLFPKIKIPEFQVEHPEKKEFGDYSTNLAFLIAKELKKKPNEIANQIAKSVEKEKIFERVEVKEPGFINFFLSLDFLFEELKKILKEKENYGKSKTGKEKTVIIDYSSPNIAKPFGIGHLRSTIIGQALYNIYKFLGYKVIGDNHLGDWGTQFGKLIFAIKNWGKKKVEDYSIEELEELYVKFHKEAEKNPQLEEEGRKWFKKLEEGDKGTKRIWKILVKISLKEFERIYELLGVKFDFALGESFYEPMTKEVIEELKEKKIAKESQGALIIEFPKNEFPPVIVQKSDGTTTYFTRDLATIKYRLKRWDPDLIIYEVGADQKLHFQQLFKTVEILGWANPAPEQVRYGARKTKFVHVAHGLYRTKTGKFSTRKGETVHLEDVLKEAIERAKEIIEKSETSRGLTEREKEKISKIVGIGAVKYNDLSQHPSKDIIFDWEKVLNLKGNSAPYLQYTFVRCQSVLEKAGSRKLEVGSRKLKIEKLKKEEIEILREIYKFPEIIQEAAEKFSPNLICNFVFDLAKKYNLFYDLYPILKAEDKETKNFRLILTKTVAQIIKNSLFILGIEVPKKM
jgi:arginyl-tRNA synthetase